jgi:DNA-binding IclR family transcriptional regulator
MVFIARFTSSKFMPIHMPIGSRIPMYCSASGRAYLSALPAAEVAAVLARSQMEAHTPHTVSAPDKVQALLAQARQRGYATNREELFLGDCAIAAPVLNNQRQAVAAIHLVVPTSRWTLEEAEQRLASMVIECARSVSNSIRNLL